jgi:tetratricopeptide (TPR) repeat protein
MSASGPVNDGPDEQESLEKLFGTVFDLATEVAWRISPDEIEAKLRRTLREAGRRPEGMPAGQQATRRLRIGEVPPQAEGFTDRPDTAYGIMDEFVPGTTLALVPGSVFAEGPENWLGPCGKTRIAVFLAESLWRSGAIDLLVWITATSRVSVVAALVQAAAAVGIEPTGTAETDAARFISWLSETSQPWLIVLDDLQDTSDLDGLWPDSPAGRVLITCTQSWVALRRRGTRVIPVGFFSVREALGYLTDRLSVNPAQRQGAIDLVEALGREPLALAQAASVVANSTLACRDYRDYFARRRQQITEAAGEVPSAAAVTWTLSLGQAESLLPGASVRLMLVLLALLDGHGIPGAIFSTPAVAAYLGGAVTPFSSAVDPKPAWDALAAIERAGLISVNRAVSPPTIGISSVLQAAIRLAAPANVREPAARTAATALLEAWPESEPEPWTAAVLRANAASLQNAVADVLWTDGCHPVLLRAGRSLDSAQLAESAMRYWQELAERCDAKLASGHPDTLVVAAHLAAAYLAAGHADEAVLWYQRVLAERGRELAPGHPAIIAARVDLAKALVLVGEPGDAVTVLQRAVRECERFRGPGHPDTLSTLDALAAAYWAAGDTSAALPLYERALAGREKVLGRDHPDTIAATVRLIGVYLAAGRRRKGASSGA